MTKQELKQEVADLVRTTLRKEGCYSENGDALLMLGEVMDSVYVDRTKIMSEVRKSLSEGRNPLNCILGLFGLRIVRPERTVRAIGSTISEEHNAGVVVEETGNAAHLETLLCVDKAKALEAIERMALALREHAAAGNRTIDSIRDQMERSIKEQERTGSELQQLRIDHQELVYQVAVWAQSVLSSDDASQMNEKVLSLLEEMDISVHWDAENIELRPSAMFTTLRRAPSYRGRNQPCLVKDGKVLVKGLVLIDEELV